MCVCVRVQEADKKAAAARKRQRKEKEKEAKPKRAKVCSASGVVLNNLLHTFLQGQQVSCNMHISYM